MKNILIISKFFAPQNEIGAIRATKLAKYLKKDYGCNITVVTRKLDDSQLKVLDSIGIKDLEYVDDIIRIEDAKWVRILERLERALLGNKSKIRDTITSNKKKPTKRQQSTWVLPNNDMPILLQVLWNIKVIVEWLKESAYSKEAMRALDIAGRDYDCVLSTYGPVSSVILGAMYKKKHTRTKWIADFRDPIDCGSKALLMNIWKRNSVTCMVRSMADAIVLVSRGHQVSMRWNNMPNIHIVSNGYDRDDLDSIKHKKSDKFTISFTGNIYQGKQDFDKFFWCIRELIDNGDIDSSKIDIVYAGRDYVIFYDMAKIHRLQSIITNYGYVSKEESLMLQMSSHLLLLASWNSKEYGTGIFPAKLLEYMMVDRPVLGVVVGDIKNSLVKKIINKGKLGYCYEYVDSYGDNSDYQGMKIYIKSVYDRYINGDIFTDNSNINASYVNQYNYRSIANKIYTIMQ